MRTNTNVRADDIGELADDARALLEATANLTGQNVRKARKRLALALKNGKATGEDVVDASVDLATDNIEELRDRISGAVNHGKEIYETVHDDVVHRAKAADHTVREHPYRTMGIALSVGAIVGFMFSFRHSRNGHQSRHGNCHEQL